MVQRGAGEQGMVDLLQVKIATEQLLLHFSRIKEVARPLPLTAVAMGPEHLLGMANMHGQIVCVLDAGSLTGLPSARQSGRSRFLLLRHPKMHVALCVDEVVGIRKVATTVLAESASDDTVRPLRRVIVESQAMYLLDCDGILHAGAVIGTTE
ncbi:MAG: chemotaxis protein CheW [Mariprofundus sp.]